MLSKDTVRSVLRDAEGVGAPACFAFVFPNAQCAHCAVSGWLLLLTWARRVMSRRGKDQFRMVTGPVSMPLTGNLVMPWATLNSFTVMGWVKAMSPTTRGGRT